ncbi:hypothetical protein UKMH10_5350 [Burkholderia pseudomallei]|nr:hypothetical protein UKMH10_5350 [Burkholderia pseudomallei]
MSHAVSIDKNKSALVIGIGQFKIASREGAWRFHDVPLFEAAKLLAFLESCGAPDGAGREYRAGRRTAR